MTGELEIERRHEPGEDTEDRLRRAVAILLAEQPLERPGEAVMTLVIDGRLYDRDGKHIVAVNAGGPQQHRIHLVAVEYGEKKWSFCRLVMDNPSYRELSEVGLTAGGSGPAAGLCRSCLEVARERLHIAIGDAR